MDCFYEGENMLVIDPDECIDWSVCEPECPVNAIKADTEPGPKNGDRSMRNTRKSARILWPKRRRQLIGRSGSKPDKLQYFSPKPGTGDSITPARPARPLRRHRVHLWLKNRDPEHWRDSQQLEHVLGKYIISDKPMTEEEWLESVLR